MVDRWCLSGITGMWTYKGSYHGNICICPVIRWWVAYWEAAAYDTMTGWFRAVQLSGCWHAGWKTMVGYRWCTHAISKPTSWPHRRQTGQQVDWQRSTAHTGRAGQWSLSGKESFQERLPQEVWTNIWHLKENQFSGCLSHERVYSKGCSKKFKCTAVSPKRR